MPVIQTERLRGAAYIIYGNGPHELVADHSAHPIFDEWQAAYDKLNQECNQ